MKEKETIVNAIREYILTCPFINELAKVNIGYLPKESLSYSIEEIPSQSKGNITKQFLNGGTERQFLFVFACMFPYNEEIVTNIENSGFFEEFQEWIEKNNNLGVLPDLRVGLTATNIETQTTGYLFYTPESGGVARYQIQCRLLYEREEL